MLAIQSLSTCNKVCAVHDRDIGATDSWLYEASEETKKLCEGVNGPAFEHLAKRLRNGKHKRVDVSRHGPVLLALPIPSALRLELTSPSVYKVVELCRRWFEAPGPPLTSWFSRVKRPV